MVEFPTLIPRGQLAIVRPYSVRRSSKRHAKSRSIIKRPLHRICAVRSRTGFSPVSGLRRSAMEYVRRTTRSFFTRRSNSEKKEKKVQNFKYCFLGVNQSGRIPPFDFSNPGRQGRRRISPPPPGKQTTNIPSAKAAFLLLPISKTSNSPIYPTRQKPKVHFAANNLGKSWFSPPAAHPRLAIRRLRLWQETDLISGRIRR